MRTVVNWTVPVTFGVVLGWTAAQFTTAPCCGAADGAPPAVNPQERTLDANLYMQTSAEYRACCLGIYQAAGDQLARVVRCLPKGGLRPAVVMDLDETVLDNSGFQTILDRGSVTFTPALWADWEENKACEVHLVPGAKAFIDRAVALGVTPVYISNRLEKRRPSTEKALEFNGLKTPDLSGRLFLQTTDAAGHPIEDKSARRDRVAATYRVLMYFGDNLRDFSEWFVAPRDSTLGHADRLKRVCDRFAKVDAAAGHWGVDWFVLPNPTYGEWQNPIGDKPHEMLRGPGDTCAP